LLSSSRYYLGIYTDGLRETMQSLGKDSQGSSQNLKWSLPTCKA